MLSSISWGQYFSCIAFLLAIYYGFVAFRFFKWEILGVIGIKRIDGKSVATPSISEFKFSMEGDRLDTNLPQPESEFDITPVVQSMADEINAFIHEAPKNVSREELLSSLKLISSKYPILKDADCSGEIAAAVYRETNKKYPNLIAPGDTIHLWQ